MATFLSLALLVQVAAADGGGSLQQSDDVVPALEVSPILNEPYGIFDRLAQCESNERWHINSGNSYYGGLQEDLMFWRRHGGLSYASRPDLASRDAQIAVARVGQRVEGWQAWPVCSKIIGLH